MKASSYRYVLRADLKLSKVSANLIFLGIVFHRVSAATLKDLAANVLAFVLGTTSKLSSCTDLNPDLLGVQNLMDSSLA